MQENMNKDDDVETLGEQLYTRILPQHSKHAGKLTGMLLELPTPVLSRMLQDEVLLAAAVEKAVKTLEVDSCQEHCKDEDDGSVSSDSLGEQLFNLIDVYNTGYSQKITGMLLEQDKDTVLKLLAEPKQLEEQLTKALKTLQQRRLDETDVSDTSDGEDAEVLGEKLFLRVEELDPVRARVITGMLLEMDAGVLRELLREHELLETAVHKAQAALGGSDFSK
ncbi:uncharacterized protein LOC144210365 [Stigmatopora nigra]